MKWIEKEAYICLNYFIFLQEYIGNILKSIRKKFIF
jgi:hypothetical protein